MKTIFPILLLMLSGCGISDSLKNVDAKMEGLNTRLDKMVKNLDDMHGSISGMDKSLSDTKDALHSQALMLAMNELLKPDNTKYITLTSVNIIPMLAVAKALAETATPEELAGIAFLWISEINLAQIDGINKQQKDAIDLGKYIKLNALQVISGLIPETKMLDMYKTQIGGNYESAVYGLVTLRYSFIKDYMIEQSMSTPMTSPIQYETVLKYLDSLVSITQLPFKGSLSLKLYGFYDTDKVGLNQTLTVDTTSVCSYYTKLKVKFDKEFDQNKYKDLTKRIQDIKIKLESCKG